MISTAIAAVARGGRAREEPRVAQGERRNRGIEVEGKRGWERVMGRDQGFTLMPVEVSMIEIDQVVIRHRATFQRGD